MADFFGQIKFSQTVYFFKYFFLVIWADGALTWGKSEENDIYWGGCDAYLEIYLADIFPRKKARSQTI